MKNYEEIIKDRVYLKISKNKNSFNFIVKKFEIANSIYKQLKNSNCVQINVWGQTYYNSNTYFFGGYILDYKEFMDYVHFLSQIEV